MSKAEEENCIAVIGISGRFPGADSFLDFWENLCKGKDSITSFSQTELLKEGAKPSTINSSKYVKSKGILNNIDLFDHNFFDFTIQEAKITDPQHRLFIECVWEALENSGTNPDTYNGLIGVYGGTGLSTYLQNNIYSNKKLKEKTGDFLLTIGNDKDFFTTKASYKLNLKGPSVNVQSACSTSLVAVCMACNQLLSYECDIAIAGSSSISVPQKTGYEYQEGMIFSKDGKCRPFDSEASGTVASNGVGVVVLKRLEDAINDKDHIYSIIRGYGINNDGHGKLNYFAPSTSGQYTAINSAISKSEINPTTITYIEAHGTGTFLGDPVEVEALNKAFATEKKQFCALGSVKSNIGHTIESAGIISLIKVILSLYYKQIPPTIHFNKPNPHLNLENSPFYVNKTLKKWTTENNSPRRAGVSAFGIGGTNAHLILEEWNPVKSISQSSKSKYPLIISAKTVSALKKIAKNLAAYLKKFPNLSIADIAYTLYIGRKRFEHQRVLLCSDIEDAVEQLNFFEPENYPNDSNLLSLNFFNEEGYQKVPLPTYPLEKQSHWIDFISKPTDTVSIKKEYDRVEDIIKQIWIDFLGEKNIHIDDDFFDLGGDSLLAIEITAALSKEFNLSLGMQTLLENPSISQLSEFISQRKKITSPLVKLKDGKNNSPIFLIHPIEGNLFCFKDFVRKIHSANSIYGIQSIPNSSESIEELSSFYLNEIKKIQPEGPYKFIGASFGGIIAFEIAKQLEQADEKVALLCLLDSGIPKQSFFQLDGDKERLAALLELIGGKLNLRSCSVEEQIIELLGLNSLDKKNQVQTLKQIQTHLKMLKDYKFNEYQNNIHFFQSSHRNLDNIEINLSEEWRPFIKKELFLYKNKGSHLAMLKQENLNDFVQQVENILNMDN